MTKAKEAFSMFARVFFSKAVLTGAAIATSLALLGGVALGALDGASPLGASASVAPLGDAEPLAEDGRGEAGKLAAVLDKLVQNGTITAEQRAKILAAIREAAQQDRDHRPDVLKDLFAEAAKVIGISVADLRKELPGHSVAQVAEKHGVSRDSLVQRLVAAANARIDKALGEGKITTEQADKLRASAPGAVTKFVDHVYAERRKPGRDRASKGVLGDLFQDAAKAIGISAGDLKNELPGKSIAQVAQAHGVTRDALIQKMIASVTGRLDDAVRDGKLATEQADRLRSQLSELISKFVDRVAPTRAR